MAPPGPRRLGLPEGGAVRPQRVACPGSQADSAVKTRYGVPWASLWQQASLPDSTTRVRAIPCADSSLRGPRRTLSDLPAAGPQTADRCTACGARSFVERTRNARSGPVIAGQFPSWLHPTYPNGSSVFGVGRACSLCDAVARATAQVLRPSWRILARLSY